MSNKSKRFSVLEARRFIAYVNRQQQKNFDRSLTYGQRQEIWLSYFTPRAMDLVPGNRKRV